jgi:hypothetical protein
MTSETLQKETFQKEAAQGVERRARLRQLEKDEAAARVCSIAISQAQTTGVNAEFFAKEAEHKAKIAANKPIVLPGPTKEEILARDQEYYPRPAVNKPEEGGVDSLLDREPLYVQEAMGYTPPKLKPSITLQPKPDQYPSNDPRHGMSEDLIRNMGMNP